MLLSVERPREAIMVGSAGALPGTGMSVGDVVVARSETLSELGVLVRPGVGDPAPMELGGLNRTVPLDRELAEAIAALPAGHSRPRLGGLVTVVGVSANVEHASARAEDPGIVAENMEGYALALAGLRLGFRAGEIRGISNQAGDRERRRWDFPLAQERSQRLALDYLRRGPCPI
jgi:futalosine hydrolase